MAGIPLAALSINTQQPNPLDTAAKAMNLQNIMQEGQTRQLQQTGLSQENQQRALQLKDQETLRSLSSQHVQKDSNGNVTGFDFDGLIKDAAGAGVSPQTLNQMQNQRAEAIKNLAGADEATRNNETAKNKTMYEALESLRALPQAQRPAALQQAIPSLQKQGVNTSQIPPNAPLDDASLTQFEAGLGMHAQILADAKTAAETNQANQKANLDKMEAAEKGSPLTKMENDPTMFAGDKLPASMAYLQSKVNDSDPATAARATRLLSIAKVSQANQLGIEASKKAADQAIQDGDPNAAAKLLVDGTVAPSQIISSRKPEFAQKAFTAAQALQPGWDARKAEGDFKVASSPAQVAFFGSAKSLTDKGGTLDQLAAAAKDIPGGQIPIFNSIADAINASTGSGPIAKYASIALGFADDYSKVMGGGQGSDTSRTQALQLVSLKQSPDQRAASIEGIRGAVMSQLNSRIGSNPVLKKMYGDSLDVNKTNAEHVPGGKAAGLQEGQTGTGSDGKKYVVKGGVWQAR